jgi:hypothetical protein
MDQSSSWEVNNHSATEEIPHILLEPEGLLQCSQQSATGP